MSWHVLGGKEKQGSIQIGDLPLPPCPSGICHQHQMEKKTKLQLSCIYFGVIIRIKLVQKHINS